MPIATTLDADRDLTLQVVTGQITEVEILAALDAFYANEPTLLVLWDLSEGDLSLLTPGAMRNLVTRVSGHRDVRRNGRTAIAAPKDLQFGFGRMVQAMSETTSVAFSIRVFRSRSEAMLWLIAGEELTPDGG